MRSRIIAYLVVPLVVAGAVFHWTAKKQSWIAWHVGSMDAYGQYATFYDYIRSRSRLAEQGNLGWLTRDADHNDQATDVLVVRTVGAIVATGVVALVLRRLGPSLRLDVHSPDPPKGAPK